MLPVAVKAESMTALERKEALCWELKVAAIAELSALFLVDQLRLINWFSLNRTLIQPAFIDRKGFILSSILAGLNKWLGL